MRNVFISGSSRGIGLAIARAFHENGDCVILNGKNDADALAAAAKSLGGTPFFLGDLSSPDICRDIFAAAGSIDVLVNNAGMAHYGLFQDMSPQEVRAVLDANLLSAIYATQAVLPRMIREKRGVIINITSIWGIEGAACEVVYSAAKAGIIGMTKALAQELAPSGIRVNAIAPAAVDTRMLAHLSPQEKQALGALTPPEKVAHAALSLTATPHTTGTILQL